MNATKKNRFQPTVENLEDRCLMTGGVTASLSTNGLLAINGTEGNDVITVRQINNRISVDGVNGSWAANQVRGIAIDARSGNDTVLLNSEALRGQQAINASTVILGGSGNDTIVGGRGNNLILGGAGNDQIYGNAGIDAVFAGTGNDSVYGGAGDDALFGQDGADVLQGEAGNDLLDGGAGYDYLFGQAGRDLFVEDVNGAALWSTWGEDTMASGHVSEADQMGLLLSALRSMPATSATSTTTSGGSIARSADALSQFNNSFAAQISPEAMVLGRLWASPIISSGNYSSVPSLVGLPHLGPVFNFLTNGPEGTNVYGSPQNISEILGTLDRSVLGGPVPGITAAQLQQQGLDPAAYFQSARSTPQVPSYYGPYGSRTQPSYSPALNYSPLYGFGLQPTYGPSLFGLPTMFGFPTIPQLLGGYGSSSPMSLYGVRLS